MVTARRWDAEINRAEILATDPEARQILRAFATGIRNGVGFAVQEDSGLNCGPPSTSATLWGTIWFPITSPASKKADFMAGPGTIWVIMKTRVTRASARIWPAKALSPMCRCNRTRPRCK